nr:glycosyltransferase family A protein [Candidatus Omnitrophota bacterium]
MGKLASIIIRTKNEERWITQCLHGVFEQEYKDYEVILVDNESEDKTLEKAGQFKLAKVVKCTEYLPGKALNMGIRESKGDYIVCLSGHCIPVNAKWLGNLLK